MKRYRLLKDLPTFRAGDEFELRDDGCLYLAKDTSESGWHWKDDVMAYHKNTLARFPVLEDWFEEIEGPKEYWYIDATVDAAPDKTEIIDCEYDKKIDDFNKSIGNYFETKEEAEQAVEKLKAWKRLKDNGFNISRWKFSSPDEPGKIIIEGRLVPGAVDDLDILFGGEDE